jgi:hypothetical protein
MKLPQRVRLSCVSDKDQPGTATLFNRFQAGFQARKESFSHLL